MRSRSVRNLEAICNEGIGSMVDCAGWPATRLGGLMLDHDSWNFQAGSGTG